MNIKDLQLFRHLAGSLHFGKTSKACNISPSGLTRTIQRLESELGKELFLRNKRSVALTSAGEILSKYSDEVLPLYHQLYNELSGDEVLGGELRLYCSVTAILSILPSILERFKNLYPQIQINLQTGDAAKALDRVERNEADISIAALPDELPRELEFIELVETPLIFIVGKTEAGILVHKENDIDWQKTPLILAERGLSRERVDSWFRHNGKLPNIYSQVAGNEAIIALVSMGCGVGVVPELVLDKSPFKDSVKIIEHAPRLTPFAVGVCTTRKNMDDPIVRAFWENVKDTLAQGEK